QGGDVGLGVSHGVEGVVARVGPAQAGAGEGDGLAGGDVLVPEPRGPTSQRDRVTLDHTGQVAAAHRGRRGGVVDLVVGGEATGGVLSGDVSVSRVDAGQRVVARVVAAQAGAGEGDGLAGGDVLVPEPRDPTSQRDRVTLDHTGQVAAAHRGRRGGVVDLVVGGEATGDVLSGDVSVSRVDAGQR